MNFTIPNLLSISRMALIPVFILSMLAGNPRRALLVFVVAGVTDALDGLIARFLNQRSLLGMYLDPIADKLLLVTAYIVLAIPSLNPGMRVPVWVTVLVIARDVLIVAVALVLHLALRVASFPPSGVSKLNTAIQIAAVLLVLLADIAPRAELAATVMVNLVGASTLISGLDYILRANRLAAR